MNPGEQVMVRAFRNEPLVRKVVAIEDDGVLVCRDETWEVLGGEGADGTPAAGFPLVHVYVYDAELYQQLRQAYEQDSEAQLEGLWHRAKSAATH